MSEFKDVMWGDDDIIDPAKLNDMASNDRFLLERVLPARYTAYGQINKSDGIKIASGIINFAPSASRFMMKDIYYSGYFSEGCRPSIQATCAITDTHRTFCVIQAIGTGILRPDHNGFRVVLHADPLAETKTYFPTVVHVHWMAIGY